MSYSFTLIPAKFSKSSLSKTDYKAITQLPTVKRATLSKSQKASLKYEPLPYTCTKLQNSTGKEIFMLDVKLGGCFQFVVFLTGDVWQQLGLQLASWNTSLPTVFNQAGDHFFHKGSSSGPVQLVKGLAGNPDVIRCISMPYVAMTKIFETAYFISKRGLFQFMVLEAEKLKNRWFTAGGDVYCFIIWKVGSCIRRAVKGIAKEDMFETRGGVSGSKCVLPWENR